MAGERTLPGLGLTAFWTAGSSGWKVGMDADLRLLSAVVQLSVESRSDALPGSPTDGVIYIVPTSDGTNPEKIAIRDAGAWVYITPLVGWIAWVKDDAEFIYYDNAQNWVVLETGGSGGALAGLSDVDFSVAPDEGDVLTRVGSMWIAQAPTGGGGGGATALDDLTDVDLTTDPPAAGDVLTFDGADWIPGTPAANPYDIATFCFGKPSASERLMRWAAPRAIALPASLTGSVAKARVAATAQTDFDVKKNTTSVGTIRFAAAGTVATFVGFGAVALAAGDILEITAPGTADTTLEDISFTFAGTR